MDDYSLRIDVSVAGDGLSEYLHPDILFWNQEEPGHGAHLIDHSGMMILFFAFSFITSPHRV